MVFIEHKKIFTLLVEQHKSILNLVQSLERPVLLKDPTLLVMQLKLLEQSLFNHYLMEESLFSKVIDNPKLKEGGPFCSYYFDTFMSQRPLNQLLLQVRKIKQNYKNPSPTADNKKYFETGSPLAIPLEDHLAILTLVEELQLESNTSKPINWRWIESSLNLLTFWLKFNHEKEENCLFKHLANLI